MAMDGEVPSGVAMEHVGGGGGGHVCGGGVGCAGWAGARPGSPDRTTKLGEVGTWERREE